MNGMISSLLSSVLSALGADAKEGLTDAQWQLLVQLVSVLVTFSPVAITLGRRLRNWPAILVLCVGVAACQRVSWAGERHLADLVAVAAWVAALVWSLYRGPKSAGVK